MVIDDDQITKIFPVVLFSAEQDVNALAVDYGADDYIQKPFDVFELSDKIKSLLYIKTTRSAL